MKKVWAIIGFAAVLLSCKHDEPKGKFVVTGQMKNAPDQKIYLEELFFSDKNPEVLDTGEIKNGKFSVTALAPEEGLYRLRMEKDSSFFVFINDKPEIGFNVDYNKLSSDVAAFNSPANASLKKFIITIQTQKKGLETQAAMVEQLTASGPADSTFMVVKNEFDKKDSTYKSFIINYVDTTNDAVMALFALGYSRNIEPEKLVKSINGLPKRFPQHLALNSLVSQYNQMITQAKGKPQEGGMAPDITMPDTSGKMFSLSSLKGKYVLVDFWASWCGPCRGENPNVVKAYNTYKGKNFTVLGVSLDKEKQPWLDAIKADNLTWYHISDLKFWSSAAVKLYGFDGIPYNVLLDPTGKIIGSNLRGEDLENKLKEILK